jgi:peptidoglycan/LPS O-acetylase OafA/YrhL
MAALLLQNWYRYPLIWNAPAWSLSAEWLAYMVFPWLLITLRSIKAAWHAIALADITLLSLALIFMVSGRSLNLMGRSAGLLRLAAEFTAGALIQRANVLGGPGWIPWRWVNPIGILFLGATLFYPPTVPLAVLLFGFLVFSLSQHGGFLKRILSSRLMVFLGEISYSMYLVQALLMELATWHIKRHPPANLVEAWLIAALLITSLLLVPILTWRTVERPARTIGRRIADRLQLHSMWPVMPEKSLSGEVAARRAGSNSEYQRQAVLQIVSSPE